MECNRMSFIIRNMAGNKLVCLALLRIGSVWIGLILLKLKTYCWNHCSKIIFKCVNSTVGPIFNEKIDKKWNLWVHKQCTNVFTEKWSKVAATVHVPYMNSSRLWGENAWKKKGGGGKRRSKTQTPIQTLPKRINIVVIHKMNRFHYRLDICINI